MTDLTGKRYGRLTVLKFMGKNQCSQQLYLVKCSCGVEKTILVHNLKVTKSCGKCRVKRQVK